MDEQVAAWLAKYTQPAEESHARCGIPDCGKLFKDATFVHKHLRNKHGEEIGRIQAHAALPFLRAAWEEDSDPPLPVIPTESPAVAPVDRPAVDRERERAPYQGGSDSRGGHAQHSNGNSNSSSYDHRCVFVRLLLHMMAA